MEKFMKINIGPGVGLSASEIAQAYVFQEWVDSLHSTWRGEVTINAIDQWKGEIYAIQMTVAREDNPWPVPITLRSETVDVLTVITDGNQQWLVFTEQYRDAAGGMVVSNVAGGRKRTETIEETASHELEEELGLEGIRKKFSVKLTSLLPAPVLASPGMINERTHMLQATIGVASRHITAFLNELRNKRTGVKEEGERIRLHVVPAHNVWPFITERRNLDAKTLLSLGYAGILGSE